MAGVAGASIGVSGGLGALLAACGGAEESTTTAAPTTTEGSTATTAAPGGETTTTAAAGVETGREVKIGWVSTTTGMFAGLGEADEFLLQQSKDAIGDGLVCADNKKHPIAFVLKDSQSDANRAAEVASDLITSDKPDLIFAGQTPVVNVPVGVQCEANGVPCITYGCPSDVWFFALNGDPAVGFKWIFNVFWALPADYAGTLGMFERLPTNKKVAALWVNDASGQINQDEETGLPSVLKPAGYSIINPGLFTPGTEDFSSVINKFKSEGCECLSAAASPPDFANFWKQAKQQGWVPKVTKVGMAILTPTDMDAVGDIGNGLSHECWWERTHPFSSSLTGLTCQEQADAWIAAKNRPYSPVLGLVAGAGFDVITDVVKRTKNVDDPQSWVEATKTTDLETLVGPVKFGTPLPNVAATPLVGGQWIGKVGGWNQYVVENSQHPEIPLTGEIADLTTL